MLNWIKQALGSGGTLQGHRYGAGIMDPLTRDLERLAKRDASLPGKALTFVVEGAGGDIPGLIRKATPPQSMWTGQDQDAEARQVRWRLYDHWDELPADFWVRFGSVLAADSPVLGHSTVLAVAQQHRWIEALGLDLAQFPVSHYGGNQHNRKPHSKASLARLEALLESVGLSRSSIVMSTFQTKPTRYSWSADAQFITILPDFQVSVVRDADLVRGYFRDKAFENRVHALGLIAKFDAAGLQPFVEELVALALESSNKVRAAAIPLALRAGTPVLQIALREAVAQKPEGRARALELLWELGDEAGRNFVRERATADSAESVRKAAAARMERGTAEIADLNIEIAVPEVKVDFHAPLSTGASDGLREIFRLHNEFIRKQREGTKDEWKKHWQETSTGGIEQVISQVARHPDDGRFRPVEVRTWPIESGVLKLLTKWTHREDVSLVHVVRLLIATQWISTDRERHTLVGPSTVILSKCGQTPGRVSLLALEEIFKAYHVALEAIADDWFNRWRSRLTAGWPDEAVWPYFATHPELICEAFNPASAKLREYSYSKDRVYDALATFPEPPEQFIPQLFELALGSTKADREGAQRVLDRYPEKIPRIIEALKSGKADVRAAAASWLARLRANEAVRPLELALAKEKHDVAAGAMMSALQLLGVPVDRFLNRGALLKDAQAGLKKGVPADLQWFPFEGLPSLEWSDTGEPVADEVRRWWIVQSFKLKSPEPGGVLRQYFAALRPPTREAFALHVLQAWLREDLKPIAPGEAEKRARGLAQSTVLSIKQHPKYYSDEHKAMTEDQLYESCLPGLLRQPGGSATASKGLLAIVAAGGGSDIAPVVHRYLKEWYGMRASQGKALIQTLAWVDHPTATQLMLSIGSRFRTKGFQEEATRQAQLLAERRNWSLDELADRTIPTAGFDSDGTGEVDYGTRRFTARLTADFQIELFSPEGKQIASLPDARKDEDEARVKEAKKQWTTAKKELKGVLQLQKDRLYEGLCTQRTWKFEDWDTYLNQHPIVRRYCQRLVWRSVRPTGERHTFRPLDDGSLTDLDDNAVALEPTAVVSLAHDSNVSEPESKGWLQHLKDYKIDALFQQFGKGIYRLPEEQAQATEVEDFKGHVLESFALRGRATKLGYTRGAAEDGGWFHRYEKRFPTLGIEAHVEFTGSPLPEENRPVALLALAFLKRGRAEEGEVRLALEAVPKVLLSECWNDMRIMAAEGSGFDPNWHKITGY
jgi:HEAT repeat protein